MVEIAKEENKLMVMQEYLKENYGLHFSTDLLHEIFIKDAISFLNKKPIKQQLVKLGVASGKSLDTLTQEALEMLYTTSVKSYTATLGDKALEKRISMVMAETLIPEELHIEEIKKREAEILTAVIEGKEANA